MDNKENKKRRFSKKSIFSLILVMLIALLLLGHEKIMNFIIGLGSDHYYSQKISKEDIEKNRNKPADYDLDAIKSIDPLDFYANQGSGIDDRNIAGFLSVPAVGIKLPIFYGVSFANLWYGTGTAKPNQRLGEGNYVLVAHRIDDANKLFRPLERASLGQQIYASDQEYIYEYNIYDFLNVSPKRGDLMNDEPGVPKITLITCADDYAVKRFVTVGSYAQKWKISEAPEYVRNSFNIKQNKAY